MPLWHHLFAWPWGSCWCTMKTIAILCNLFLPCSLCNDLCSRYTGHRLVLQDKSSYTVHLEYVLGLPNVMYIKMLLFTSWCTFASTQGSLQIGNGCGVKKQDRIRSKRSVTCWWLDTTLLHASLLIRSKLKSHIYVQCWETQHIWQYTRNCPVLCSDDSMDRVF